MECAQGAGEKYEIAEGEGGLEAWLWLDVVGTARLGLVGCVKGNSSTSLDVIFEVQEKAAVSPQLARLRSIAFGEKTNMELCLNKLCVPREWEFNDYFALPGTSIELNPRLRLTSIQVLIPGDSGELSFEGDLSSILGKICSS